MARRVRPITSPARLEGLTTSQRGTYTRALHARRLMQNAGFSRARAAREAGTTPRTMSGYLGDALDKRGGRWQAASDAELYSYVQVPTTSGVQRIAVSSREADLVRRYKDALWRYDHTGDDSGLVDLEGESIGGYTLLTDPADIEELIERGELDPRDVGSGETGR